MSDATGIPSPVIEPKSRNPLADFFIRLIREKPVGTASGIIILLLIFVAIFGGVLSPYPYDEAHIHDMMKGPSAQYLLGTDQLGRDLLSRIIYGARISLLVGLTVTTLSVVVSTLIGGTSGFIGGKLDLGVQRFVDAWLAFPRTAPAVDDDVHSGARSAADNTGPGDIRRHWRQSSNQRRRDRHQRECVFSCGRRRWLLEDCEHSCATWCRMSYRS